MIEPAVTLTGLSKAYKLYPCHSAMALDWCGFYFLRFWKKRPVFPLKRAVDDISAVFEKGKSYGILGRNGAGKTTLLKLIAELIKPTSGKIIVSGSVQLLSSTGNTFHPEFTGKENVRYSLLYKGLRGEALENAYKDIVEFAELGDFMDQPVKNYSLGMSARLQFATATAIKPEILIIDEVLGAGDAYFSAKSAERMKALTKSGCTLLLVSHSKTQILEFCERGLWVDEGKIKMQGAIEDVMSAYECSMMGSINETPSAASDLDMISIPAPMKREFLLRTVEDLFKELTWGASIKDNVLREGRAINAKAEMRQVKTYSGDKASNRIDTGQDFKVEFDISGTEDLSSNLKIKTYFFTHSGELAAECGSPVIEPGASKVVLNLSPFPLGHRDFFLVFTLWDKGQVSHALSGYYLKVNETNDSDPPLLHYPAKWLQNNDTQPVLSRISGVQ